MMNLIHTNAENNNENNNADVLAQVVVAQEGAQNNANVEAEENADQEEAEVEDPRADVIYVLGTPTGKKIAYSGLGCIVAAVVCVIISIALPWFHVSFEDNYYCKDQFLWLFLLAPLTIIPLSLATFGMGRVCWMHCWTVTVVSIGVPSAVIFVSFGASLVYTGIGAVEWLAGSFMIIIAHITSICGGLLYMKLAQLIEAGPPPVDENAEPVRTDLTVAITIDDSLSSPKPSFTVIKTGTPISQPDSPVVSSDLVPIPAAAKLDGMEATYIYALPSEEPTPAKETPGAAAM